MALVLCPDCGTEVSSLAEKCPRCGCPIAKKEINKKVKIKIPYLKSTWLNVALPVEIVSGSKVLWEGKSANIATFEIDKPQSIIIRTKGNKGFHNPINGTIAPGLKYSIVQDCGIHWKATWILTEVDVIDSE